MGTPVRLPFSAIVSKGFWSFCSEWREVLPLPCQHPSPHYSISKWVPGPWDPLGAHPCHPTAHKMQRQCVMRFLEEMLITFGTGVWSVWSIQPGGEKLAGQGPRSGKMLSSRWAGMRLLLAQHYSILTEKGVIQISIYLYNNGCRLGWCWASQGVSTIESQDETLCGKHGAHGIPTCCCSVYNHNLCSISATSNHSLCCGKPSGFAFPKLYLFRTPSAASAGSFLEFWLTDENAPQYC